MIVRKPWGEEFIFYETETVAFWLLKITPGFCTSLHSHPQKLSTLLVIEGNAELSFMNDTHSLKVFDKRIIRRGVFHSTANVGDTNLYLVETECPKDKNDLLRLQDKYGRAGKPYEGPESYLEEKPEFVFDDRKVNFFKGLMIYRLTLEDEVDFDEFHLERDSKMVITKGIIHYNGIAAASEGDMLDWQTFCRLTNDFMIAYPIELMVFERVKNV